MDSVPELLINSEERVRLLYLRKKKRNYCVYFIQQLADTTS